MKAFALACLASFAHTGLVAAPALAQADLTGSAWLAEDIRGAGVIDRAQSTLQILPGGRVAGSGGCNRFTGNGVIADGKAEIGLLATTRMACPPALMDQEDRYLKALAASRRYEITADNILRLYDRTGEHTIRYSRTK